MTSNKIQFIIVTTLALLINAGCAHTDEWTTRDTILQVGLTLTLAADARTTSRIHKTSGVYERGPFVQPILGSQPDPVETYLFFTSLALSDYLIARALPAKWRPYFQGSLLAGHAYWVGRNCELDLCR